MRWILGIVALAGCYSPSPKEGARCSVTSECPAPLVCELGVCGRGGHGAVDAMTDAPGDIDATPGDGAPLFQPSNMIDPTTALGLTMPIVVDGTTTFNTDTGRVTGALSRAPGIGVSSGIGYHEEMFGATPLAVFSFHSLEVQNAGTIQFSGSRAVVLVIARDVAIAGDLDLTGCTAGACPGPGGGNGTQYTATGGGGCGGAGGMTNAGNSGDGGGGGGGGGDNGAKGGDDDEGGGTIVAGGAGGIACIPETLEPLVGGSGGAGGGPGIVTGSRGGSGGGAVQITAYGAITITGTIDASGGGGGAGGADPNGANAGAGAGGGAGGAILLEAPLVTLAAGSIVVANGGAGGGASGGDDAGSAGQSGRRSATPAAGGLAGNTNNGDGGDGGAGNTPAEPGENVSDANAGGGGGGVGRIRIRAGVPVLGGITSPAPSSSAL